MRCPRKWTRCPRLAREVRRSIWLTHNALSVYDAMYLELAVRMQIPLAKLDRVLLGAAQSAGVDGLAID